MLPTEILLKTFNLPSPSLLTVPWHPCLQFHLHNSTVFVSPGLYHLLKIVPPVTNNKASQSSRFTRTHHTDSYAVELRKQNGPNENVFVSHVRYRCLCSTNVRKESISSDDI